VTIERLVTVVLIEMRLIDEGSTLYWVNLDSVEITGTVEVPGEGSFAAEFWVISISVRSMDGWS